MANSKVMPGYKASSNTEKRVNKNGWKQIGHFGPYLIYAQANKRRLIEQKTGKIIIRYKDNNEEEGEKVPTCSFHSICPYYTNALHRFQGTTVVFKEEYCHGKYERCGRYMLFKLEGRDKKERHRDFQITQPRVTENKMPEPSGGRG